VSDQKHKENSLPLIMLVYQCMCPINLWLSIFHCWHVQIGTQEVGLLFIHFLQQSESSNIL
jgi:hypothetical protein